MRDKIEITHNTLRIKGVRNKIFDDDYGVMAQPPFNDMPQDKFINFWTPWYKEHKNAAEFMYCDNRLPHCDEFKRNDGTRYKVGFETGSQAKWKFGYMKGEWQKFIKWSGLKKTDVWGVSQKELNAMFMEFYMSRCNYKFNNAVNAMMDYVRKKRAEMTEEERAKEKQYAPFLSDDSVWVKGCRPYLLDFVIHKTVKGFLMEMILLEALTEKIGGYYIESSRDDENEGIDGYFVLNGEKYKICLKANSFKGTKEQSVINNERLVYYDFDGNDIVFRFETGGDILIMNDTCFF